VLDTVAPFARERERWIRRHLAAVAMAQAAAIAGPFGDGVDAVPGDRTASASLPPRCAPGARRSRASAGCRRRGTSPPAATSTGCRTSRRMARERARVAIDRAIARHAAAGGTTAVTIRDQRSRWGSASRTGRLSFSWRLVLAPPEALETVVVHELAHLRVFGHGPGFWELVATRAPEHVRWRRWLRQHAAELHAALR
jgi:hypothetical protein